MPSRAPVDRKRDFSAKELDSLSPDELVCLLVKQLTNDKNYSVPTPQESDAQEIMIDTVFDGFHYRLIRLPQSARAQVALSPREQEIVRMVAQGHPNKVIAGVLNISCWTVCT